MLRRMVRSLYLITFLLAASFAIAQTEFSAEIVDTQKADNPNRAKIYMAKDKLRIEPTAGTMGKGPGGAVIMNLATQTTTVLMDQQHMYMEMPAQVAIQRIAYNFFRTGDVENACSDWAQSVKNKGGSCHKVGSDTVNGRSTVKYEGTNANGESSTFWIDPKLRFPVKWQGKNNGGELRDIQEGTQPASLFEIPSDYKKFEMPNMGGMTQRPQ
jgi:hypothetical protein